MLGIQPACIAVVKFPPHCL